MLWQAALESKTEFKMIKGPHVWFNQPFNMTLYEYEFLTCSCLFMVKKNLCFQYRRGSKSKVVLSYIHIVGACMFGVHAIYPQLMGE